MGAAATRIISDTVLGRDFRETYWEACQTGGRLRRLLEAGNHAFARHVTKDLARFIFNAVQPISGETRERALAAADWLVRAQAAASGGGVSLGYFPCDVRGGWRQAYPETTGYIISSLLNSFRRLGREDLRSRALTMAEWEIAIQMDSGAVQGGMVCEPERRTPCAFNTGMVMDGWISAYSETGDRLFLNAALRAANWLISDLTPEGYFKTNGEFVSPAAIKTYNCLIAWPLYRLGQTTDCTSYREAAIKIVEAAVRQQRANGWFENNCLTRAEAPLLHTIGYTLQGIFEVALLARRYDLVDAVQRGLDPVLNLVSQRGFLPGRVYSDWQPASWSSCLTGSAQVAVVSYRMFLHTKLQRYREAAERIVNFLKALQELRSTDSNINGALAGSFPVFGAYMTAGYPNWATKYFLDCLMLQEEVRTT